MHYPFADKPDEELARAARDGDDGARARLLDIYDDILFTCAVRLLGDPELAEAALRDGFTRWFRGLRRSGAPHGVRGSMYRMALAASRAAGKGSRPRIGESPRAAAERDEELKSSGAQVAPPDRRAQLQWILSAVPARSRELLVLIDVMGLTEEQAAFVLSVKRSDIPAALDRASRGLVGAYMKYGPPHGPGTQVSAAALRAELRAMGWETAPWHLSGSLHQALRDRRDPARSRRRALLLAGLVFVAALVFLWMLL
jgi:DNA-directed RNA polymerase specialized sigma24 family protein